MTVLVLSLVTSALIGIVIILIGDFDETELKILATTGAVAASSILLLPGVFHLERAKYHNLSCVGISSSLVLLCMVFLMIWAGFYFDTELFVKCFSTLGIVSLVTNHALLLLIARPTKPPALVWQYATILSSLVLAALILLFIWTHSMPMPRLFGSLSILAVLGTITIPIFCRTHIPR